MRAYLQEITGWDGAITSMFMSKGTWTPKLGEEIHDVCDAVLTRRGFIKREFMKEIVIPYDHPLITFTKWVNMLCKIGSKHTTLLRFIDFCFVVDDVHRAAQDDFDAHAKRFDNRIVRLSTRLSAINENRINEDTNDIKLSSFYDGKVLTLGQVLKIMNIELPDEIIVDGSTYIRGIDGYINGEYKDNYDVARGLYKLGLSSLFVFKCNLCEYAHVRDLRMKKTPGHPQSGRAHPELWDLIDAIDTALYEKHKQFDSNLFDSIKQ